MQLRPAAGGDLATIYDAVYEAKTSRSETLTDVAQWFGVSRGWIYDNVIPAIEASASR